MWKPHLTLSLLLRTPHVVSIDPTLRSTITPPPSSPTLPLPTPHLSDPRQSYTRMSLSLELDRADAALLREQSARDRAQEDVSRYMALWSAADDDAGKAALAGMVACARASYQDARQGVHAAQCSVDDLRAHLAPATSEAGLIDTPAPVSPSVLGSAELRSDTKIHDTSSRAASEPSVSSVLTDVPSDARVHGTPSRAASEPSVPLGLVDVPDAAVATLLLNATAVLETVLGAVVWGSFADLPTKPSCDWVYVFQNLDSACLYVGRTGDNPRKRYREHKCAQKQAIDTAIETHPFRCCAFQASATSSAKDTERTLLTALAGARIPLYNGRR